MSAPPITEPPASPAPEHQASLEHLLLRFGLVTLDQLSAALREQAETGTPFTDSLVRDGVVSADDLARVAERAPAPAPAPQVEPEPEPAPEPPSAAEVAPPPLSAPPVVSAVPHPPVVAAVPEPPLAPVAPFTPPTPPAPAAPPAPFAPEPVVAAVPPPPPAPLVTGFVVRGRLVNGDEIEIASVDDAAEAQRIARDAMRACARPDGSDWPILNGRYVRPESIVAIDVAERS